MRYQTTKPILSLADGGFSLGERQPISPGLLPERLWDALLAEGVIVEVKEAEEMVEAIDLGKMTIDELKAEADTRGVPYTWNIKAATLRKRLENA